MYLDIFKEKSVAENLKSLQAYVIILSSIIMITISLSEIKNTEFIGTMKAITMMMGFWLLCSAFQNYLQKISNPLKLIIFLLLSAIQWFGIFMYFVKKY